MRAKFINEIKQSIEGSGFGPLSVGKSNVLRSYNMLNKRWPEWFNENAPKLSEIFDQTIKLSDVKKSIERLKYYQEVLEEYSDTPAENYICVSVRNDAEFRDTDELTFDMGFDFDDSYEMFNEEFDNGRKVIFSSRLNYINRLSAGIIYLNIAEKHDNIFHYIFVKYK